MGDDAVLAAAEKMRAAGQNEDSIRNFVSALTRVRDGAAAFVSSSELEPVPDEPALEDLPDADPAKALASVAVIKLNGGLATSMGLQQPKSLLEAREGRSFLDIIVRQIRRMRERYRLQLPLVLMNSLATRDPSLAVLARYPSIATPGLDQDFLQSMVPKLDPETFQPVSWERAPELEWNPPGHGDVYSSLRGSGMLAALLERGYRYAMISNSDNLGSTPDARIAAHMARERIPFLMEAVIGTEAERKGGHIARRKSDGQLILRETAQTPPEEIDSFTDFRRWRYYNTNSLWVDLEVLERRLAAGEGLELPVIVNHKTVDPRDRTSPPVIQLESAMGAAIGSFPGARVLAVPRTRFVPVKTTDDLLLLRSDVYRVDEELHVVPVKDCEGNLPFVALAREHYGIIDDFERRIPTPLSLRQAERLVVKCDATFGANVSVHGAVELPADMGRVTIEPDTVLDQESLRRLVGELGGGNGGGN